jgi:sugar/nucleoside kinase (ribokinase family)
VTGVDILIPGHYYCDLVFAGLTDAPAVGTEIFAQGMELVPGGGAINTTVALHRLGARARWLGALGDDFASRFVGDWLADEGIDLALVERRAAPFRRVTAALSYPADRAFVTYNRDPRIDLIPKLEQTLTTITPRHLHFCGLHIDERLPPLLKAWRARGITVSMDCQHRPHTIDMPLVHDTLCQLDLFMPNTSEMLRLTRQQALEDAANLLTPLVARIVIKDGAHGAWLFGEAKPIHVPAVPVTPVDTTGAGDVFNAGFLAAHLAGNDPVTCLQWGNACGGLSTLGYGGAVNAPTREALQTALAYYAR